MDVGLREWNSGRRSQRVDVDLREWKSGRRSQRVRKVKNNKMASK